MTINDMRLVSLILGAAVAACGSDGSTGSLHPSADSQRWCDRLPRAANADLERVETASDWFQVLRLDGNVFAILEPNQFQETISYLILGEQAALLFDTGLGLVPIRPLVEELTPLPVRVLNSHTHYDHVGGNAEFEDVLAMDTPYTRSNQRGFSHPELAGEVAAEAFCVTPPAVADTASFRTRAWTATEHVSDGALIDLGDRILEVVHVPGHTPDAVALLDRANRTMWTGDSYYDATLWLYVPETDLDAYRTSMERLAALAPEVDRLHPAHNGAVANPAHLASLVEAIDRVRAGEASGREASDNRVIFPFDPFSILTSTRLLAGERGDPARGGSGLTTW